MSDVAPGPGWWLASDHRWYPPESRPGDPNDATTYAAPVGPNASFKRLRYGGTCVACGRVIEPEGSGWHDPDAPPKRKITCSTCRTQDLAPTPSRVTSVPVNPVGGSSALRVSRERHHPNYQKGSVGEYLLSRRLHEDLGDQAVILDDRQVPNSQANIDHVVVASSGVWVIDAKKWQGKIEYKNVGRSWEYKMRLLVDGRDETKLTDEIYSQVIPVAQILGDPTIPINPALVFINGEWTNWATVRLLADKPYEHQRVLITAPKTLVKKILEPGPLDAGTVHRLGSQLSAVLKPR